MVSDQPDPVYPLLRGVSENCHEMRALLRHHAPHQRVCSAGGPRPWGERPPQGNCESSAFVNTRCRTIGCCTASEGGGGGPVRALSGQACRLWNNNKCTFWHCRHVHVCINCGGGHPVTACPGAGSQLTPHRGPVSAPKHPPNGARPY